jgi:hypothetical protein
LTTGLAVPDNFRGKETIVMPTREQFKLTGSQVVEKVRQLIHEGNVRRVRLIHDGRTLIEVPLSIGAPVAVLGILYLPILAALGAATALLTECTLEVEKMEDKP